ncbi:MAG: YaiO family outer membrane beta-barrel protein, partial [Pyrinomonadaceae bacterium]|nr:YaiO family outer membrane beta-barrel protein [Pyrinomonadaceae bacterium]
TDVSVHKKFNDKQIVWGGFRNTQRNAIHDQQMIAGAYTPFAKKWGVTAEVEVSPNNNFIGKVNLYGKIERVFPKGWIGHGGVRFRSYRDVNVATAFGTAERYWGNNLAGYTFNFTTLSSGGTAPSHRVHYSRYYGERVNSFGFAVAAGQEVENLGPGLGVLKSNTWSVSTSVRHWVTDSFGIMLDGNIHRQGDLYYRRGLNFGVRYRF